MPDHVVKYVSDHGIRQDNFATLEEALPDTDVLYMTRIQEERFASQEEYKKVSRRMRIRLYRFSSSMVCYLICRVAIRTINMYFGLKFFS